MHRYMRKLHRFKKKARLEIARREAPGNTKINTYISSLKSQRESYRSALGMASIRTMGEKHGVATDAPAKKEPRFTDALATSKASIEDTPMTGEWQDDTADPMQRTWMMFPPVPIERDFPSRPPTGEGVVSKPSLSKRSPKPSGLGLDLHSTIELRDGRQTKLGCAEDQAEREKRADRRVPPLEEEFGQPGMPSGMPWDEAHLQTEGLLPGGTLKIRNASGLCI